MKTDFQKVLTLRERIDEGKGGMIEGYLSSEITEAFALSDRYGANGGITGDWRVSFSDAPRGSEVKAAPFTPQGMSQALKGVCADAKVNPRLSRERPDLCVPHFDPSCGMAFGTDGTRMVALYTPESFWRIGLECVDACGKGGAGRLANWRECIPSLAHHDKMAVVRNGDDFMKAVTLGHISFNKMKSHKMFIALWKGQKRYCAWRLCGVLRSMFALRCTEIGLYEYRPWRFISQESPLVLVGDSDVYGCVYGVLQTIRYGETTVALRADECKSGETINAA